ncbi:hypothetical protein D3C77_221930 [compost metagenome]
MKKILLTALLSASIGNVIADENITSAPATIGAQQSGDTPSSDFDPTLNVYFNKADIKYVKVINHIGTIPLKVRLEDANDPGVIDFTMNEEFIFDWDNGQSRFEYDGAKLQMLDLNDGGASDDLFQNESGVNFYMKYEPVNERQGIIIDMSSGSVGSMDDNNGIAGHLNARVRGYYDPAVTGQDTIFIYLEPDSVIPAM